MVTLVVMTLTMGQVQLSNSQDVRKLPSSGVIAAWPTVPFSVGCLAGVVLRKFW